LHGEKAVVESLLALRVAEGIKHCFYFGRVIEVEVARMSI
jgi:hypothetical protein